jgi:hypothetical protein
MTAIVIAEAVVILVLLLLVGGLLKSHAEILRQLDRLGAPLEGSAPVPLSPRPPTTGLAAAPIDTVVGVDPAGASRSVTLASGRDATLLAFLSSGCASCRTFWTAFGAGERPVPAARLVVVTKGPKGESPSAVAGLATSAIPVVMSDEAWDAFRVPMTPYFVLIDSAGGVVGEGSATTSHQLGTLMQRSAADLDPTRLDTDGRKQFTDDALDRSGIEPGDPSLYQNPLEP